MPTDYAIKDGRKVMEATTYTANGGTQTVTNAGAFKPDFVWNKTRSISGSHNLVDSVRGISKYLFSNSTAAEGTDANYLTSLNSDGFSLGSTNFSNGTTMVAWQWQAGQGTTSSNTSGSITSTVSVNATAGFSIVTYTGKAGGGSWGHGLGVEPKFIIFKRKSSAQNWFVFHKTSGAWRLFEGLNTTAADSDYSGSMSASSTTVTLPTLSEFTSDTASTYLAYCWSEVAGFSKFGSYTGNASADGPFVYTGFRPKFVMVKRTDTAGYDWFILDTTRDQYNVASQRLYADLSQAEDTAAALDIVSNGFKLRISGVGWNASGGTYIYACFAENPFKYSNAR